MYRNLSIFGLLTLMMMFIGSSAWASIADCGLGSTIIKNKGVVSQTIAYTTNGTYHSFTVTTQTSGCDYSSIVQEDKLPEIFVHQTFDNLEEDAARGQGPYLNGLADLLGCSPEVHADFARVMQQNYDELFVTAPESQKESLRFVQQIRDNIRETPGLASSCTVS